MVAAEATGRRCRAIELDGPYCDVIVHRWQVVSKRRVFEDGRASGGLPFSRGALYHLLQNPVYRGMIVHKDRAYPGEHAAIVDQDLWDAVQRKLRANGVERSDGQKTDSPAILTGVLFDAAGEPRRRPMP